MKELFFELQEFISVYQQNFCHAQKIQKQAHNKEIKPQNYALDNKI